MDSWKVGSSIVLLALIVWIVAAVVALVTSNELFVSSDWQVASGVTLVFFLGMIGLYIAVGRPWSRWNRTAYW